MSAPGTTPGPWKHFQAYNEDHELIADRVIGADGYRIIDDVPLSADAHLIAASPALYDALENLLATVRGEGGTKYHAHEIAEAALAQARGEAA